METVTAALLGNSGFVERQMVTTVFSLLGNSGLVPVGSRWCRSVLEYARRAVTVRRAENRVQCSSNVVGLQCGQWCRTVRPVLDGVGRFSSMRDGL